MVGVEGGVERGYIAQNPSVLNFIPGRYPSKKKTLASFSKNKMLTSTGVKLFEKARWLLTLCKVSSRHTY